MVDNTHMEIKRQDTENRTMGAWLYGTEPAPDPEREALRPANWEQYAIGDAHIRAAIETETKEER